MKTKKIFCFEIIILGTAGLLSCRQTSQDVCQYRFPKEEKEIVFALKTLKLKARANSKQVSIHDETLQDDEPSVQEEHSPSDRNWAEWAMLELRETQRYVDVIIPLSIYQSAEVELSEAAKEWVEFYSYAKRNDLEKMIKTLKNILSRLRKSQDIVCRSKTISN